MQSFDCWTGVGPGSGSSGSTDTGEQIGAGPQAGGSDWTDVGGQVDAVQWAGGNGQTSTDVVLKYVLTTLRELQS